MSSILKALEKVDESQRSRRPAGTGGLPKARGRRPAWLIPVWTLAGAAIATLATYALMGGFSRPAARVTPNSVDAVATAAPAAAVPAQAASAVGQQQAATAVAPEHTSAAAAAAPVAAVKPARPAVEPAKVAAKPALVPVAATAPKQVAQPVAKPVTQAAAKAATKPQIPARVAAKQLAQPSVMAKASAVAQPAVVQPAPAAPVPASVAPQPVPPHKSRPDIRVTGIAWQNSSESSFAMVNGSPMRQGNSVNGYKIEQIYEDSVRFSNSKGNSLVVPLGAGEE
ncbi:hypothetical protein KP005_11110 [Geomonas nitrogeniifigens]|uniref:General secretion pathway protein B n=1 Tax=Geomonas diazotrophica TaxID=2843197 RepID=A0ABX8JBY2_9BACT|nr:hypothetical protein [Geomonas nitrogeniifigens]QWV95935.1 hypothetical protein KP005_11110 [Geomonas nitrogeniifigens]